METAVMNHTGPKEMVRSANLGLETIVAVAVAFSLPIVAQADSTYHDMSEYRRMPKLYQYDSYENCMQSKPAATFCVVKTVVKPDNKSEIWEIIEYIINDWLLPNISALRQQHGSVINICQNYKLQTEYNLSSFSEIEYCTTGEIGARTYESNLLTAFSVRRNIHRLTEAPPDNQFQQDLGFLDAVRVLAMTIVIFSHVLIGERMTTSQTPELAEIADSMSVTQIFAAICPYTVNIFLAVSGFLLAVFFIRYTENKRFNLNQLWMGVVNRYLRSFPVYLMVMLYTVSVSDLLQYSPSAYQFMVLSKAACRGKWWINFLYISNYYQPQELCLIHTWYLSADFQLFVIGLAAMMVMWRYPQSWKWIMGTLFGVGFALPAIRTYVFALDAMMPISNKGHHLRLWYERLYVDFYQTTDVHCASYFAGMFVGIIYHKIRKNEQLIKKSRIFKVLQYLIVPLLLAFFLPAPVFNELDLPKPSLWMGLYAGLHRWVFAISLAVIFLMYIFNESGTLFGWLRESRILQNAFIRVSGRLSFSIYLIHLSVLEAILSNQHEAVRLSMALMITVFCSVTMISYILAFLAFVFIEKPCDIMFKQLLSGGSGNSGPRKNAEEGQNNSSRMISVSIQTPKTKH
ncbi:O-acyltransferase like protein-like [Sabethes cyaneus]|uniref:O-acyltransferase like protein-like n=1 Tax=Sabethes cyaneus TaxID=53552 RepID=UPI00237DFBCE|nr:O-acyltransferase like protein-like [Sabethes cyaneus]